MIKLTITKTNPDWLEATWLDNDVQVWSESFSGHREHIQVLESKCSEFETELNIEQLTLVQEIKDAFVYQTQEELDAIVNEQKLQEAKNYLQSTDWIVVKIQEAQIKGEDVVVLLEKYSVELQKRDEARFLINEIGGD